MLIAMPARFPDVKLITREAGNSHFISDGVCLGLAKSLDYPNICYDRAEQN